MKLLAIFIVSVVFLSGCISTEQMSDNQTPNLNYVFSCDNDNSVQVRGYVYLHGFGDHNIHAFDYQRSLIEKDPKVPENGILDFDYDEKLTLSEIRKNFVLEFNEFSAQGNFDEIIIIGQSAGGIIASESAHLLNFNGIIELHTLASPINGYGAPSIFLGDLSGFEREIALGFDPFTKPSDNVKIYHHKTVNDEELTSRCGGLPCTALDIQNNNVEGSEEFFYPDYDHTTIIHAISKLIINCHH